MKEKVVYLSNVANLRNQSIIIFRNKRLIELLSEVFLFLVETTAYFVILVKEPWIFKYKGYRPFQRKLWGTISSDLDVELRN